MDININLKELLREWQKEFFKTDKRFNVVVAHRRIGKTFATVMYLIYKALQVEGNYGYISPFYRQSKAIAWNLLRKLGEQIPGTEFNVSEMTATMVNGSTIRLFGGDNPDSLRGLDLKGMVFDEYAQMSASIYPEIIFPMINYHKGWVVFIGTPKGKNSFYHLYQRALKDDRWNTTLLKASQTNLLDEEQLQDARNEMTEEEYNQEYECSWTASLKGAVYGKELATAYSEGRIKKGIYDENLPVTTFWDLGMADAMAIGFIQVVGPEIRIIDRYTNSGYGFEHYTNEMIKKGYNYEKHYFPHDIANRELATGTSRLETVKKLLGPECYVVPMNSIESGISAGRLIFKYLYIEEGLDDFLNNLSLYQYEYDDKKGDFRDKPKHDFTSHDADWFRYMATIYRALTTIPKKHKISRTHIPR